MSETVVLQHPTIGPIRGINKVAGVTQLLGVQYATLVDRFAPGVLLEAYAPEHARSPNGVLDATTIGPIPISPANGCSWEQDLIQQSLPSPELEQNDTECLTLNISVPEHASSAASALPVLVLVHGGAFATGSSSYPQYDLARIVQASVEQGQPIIAIGINYRLGVAGFLHSKSMAAAGYKANNGLHDQRLALKWIRKHVAGFNGDSERVTLMGESAGAASGTFHLHSDEPLFSQLIAMSGSSLVKAKPMALGERSFAGALQLLANDETAASDANAPVQRFLDASIEDVREIIGRKVPLTPLVDGDLIPRATTYSAMADKTEAPKLFPGMKWCKRVLVGDCEMDGSAYAPRIAARTDILPKSLGDNLKASLDPVDPSLAPAIISGYGLDVNATTNTPESLEAVLRVATDICFALGARAFASTWSEGGSDTESFLYRFNLPNPWDGPWKGHATHILDIAVVLQNYRERLAPGQQQASDRFTKHVISFVNGGSPWPAYQHGSAEGAMVYFAAEQGDNDESRFVAHETPETVDRRDIILRLTQPVLDKVMEAWEGFMKGPK